jgi:MFS superfamily sulfate permease-like transporter
MRGGFLRYIPPQLTVVVVGVVLAQLYHLDAKYLIKVPENVLEHGFVFPDFKLLMASLALLPQVVVFVLALTFVDGTESLATIQAVDRIDPFHRKSSCDRTLLAMGVSNICSSLIGGLTIIPGIIKSTTCIVSGGRTAWVNFYNACFLITFLLLAGNLIRMIPVAALAAVLMHIGYKLAGPHKWRAMAQLGGAQLAIFSVTILVTLSSDLLVGIFTGMLLKVFVLLWYGSRDASGEKSTNVFKALFTSPLERTNLADGRMDIYFKGALNCFNSLKVRSIMDGVPQNVNKVVLHFTEDVRLVDHSTVVYFNTMRDDWTRVGRELEFVGLEQLQSCAQDPASLKYRTRAAAAPVAA